MSNILSSEDFGLKLYNKFPPKYREDDVDQKFALKRYLQSASDGGFKPVIEDINGLTELINPSKTRKNVLPILFRYYGLEVFNGIPESYLRYLLPKLGEAWSKKGSLSVVEFISSSLSGIKTSTEVVYDEFGNPDIEVRLEMDYSMDGSYFPDIGQFKRLLENFIPFYCDLILLNSYLFSESQSVVGSDSSLAHLTENSEDSTYIVTRKEGEYNEGMATIGEAVLGVAVLGRQVDTMDTYTDSIKMSDNEDINIKQPTDSLVTQSNDSEGDLYTNDSCCDIITYSDGTKSTLYN